jgi:hypothetical protein
LVVTTLVAALAVALGACGGGKTDQAHPDRVFVDLSADRGNLDGVKDQQGREYRVYGNMAHTDLVVKDGRMRRGNPDAAGPIGAPQLVIPQKKPVSRASVSYVFTKGSSAQQNVVLGACETSLAIASIQFAVFPDHWLFFYTLRNKPIGNGTAIVPLATGKFSKPLATDGKTVYTTTMSVDLDKSEVTVTMPAGTRTFKDPHVAQLWGNQTVVQIRHPTEADGDAQVTEIWTETS